MSRVRFVNSSLSLETWSVSTMSLSPYGIVFKPLHTKETFQTHSWNGFWKRRKAWREKHRKKKLNLLFFYVGNERVNVLWCDGKRCHTMVWIPARAFLQHPRDMKAELIIYSRLSAGVSGHGFPWWTANSSRIIPAGIGSSCPSDPEQEEAGVKNGWM